MPCSLRKTCVPNITGFGPCLCSVCMASTNLTTCKPACAAGFSVCLQRTYAETCCMERTADRILAFGNTSTTKKQTHEHSPIRTGGVGVQQQYDTAVPTGAAPACVTAKNFLGVVVFPKGGRVALQPTNTCRSHENAMVAFREAQHVQHEQKISIDASGMMHEPGWFGRSSSHCGTIQNKTNGPTRAKGFTKRGARAGSHIHT